jgi:redox-sensing transcriptional repressor
MLIDCALVKSKIPEATVKRLSLYLNCIAEVGNSNSRISSEKLAKLARVNPAQVRRDLSYLGSLGTRGVGYDLSTLKNQLNIALGLVEGWSAIIVGAGNLGSALAQYEGFEDKGFAIVGLYDVDSKKISTKIAGLVVKHIEKINDDVKKYKVAIGIITTPSEFAQDTANLLIAGGIKSILNFAPSRIESTDSGVVIKNVDLSQELQVLSYYLDEPLK